jgi:hypothetical protein
MLPHPTDGQISFLSLYHKCSEQHTDCHMPLLHVHTHFLAKGNLIVPGLTFKDGMVRKGLSKSQRVDGDKNSCSCSLPLNVQRNTLHEVCVRRLHSPPDLLHNLVSLRLPFTGSSGCLMMLQGCPTMPSLC